MKILWLAPNFNHYKARFLNHLAKSSSIDLTILSGTGRQGMGDQELEGDWGFEHIKVNMPKNKFGNSKAVRNELKSIFHNFDWVLIPAEKKNLPLFLYAMRLRNEHKTVRLFSYNHPVLKSKNGRITFSDKLITKFFYKKLDRVIFYTEQSHNWAIKNKLINAKKAFWANNTIDNTEVEKYYSFHLPPINQDRIVFIGRLIASKKIEVLVEYYQKLKRIILNLKLDIIGDGPEKTIVEHALKENQDIQWHGTLVDESRIAPIMERASVVFIPGHSGLSINHAFAYGRPYITLQGPSHAPELDYIDEGSNGYVLKGDIDSNIKTIENLLINRSVLEQFCEKAKLKGVELSVQNWVQQLRTSLLDE
tara:strand:+ start:1462 stop:2553 length:1092 start_codon:yes stop_codon:yes gene_type:complete